jgi:hypothetical protein
VRTEQRLAEVVELAHKVGHVLVATADADGASHVAVGERLAQTPGGRLALTAWYCPGTVSNLQVNRHLALVAWAPDTDVGYQVLGEVEGIEELGVLDGYGDSGVTQPSGPPVQRRFVIRADRVLHFTHMPHNDVEE